MVEAVIVAAVIVVLFAVLIPMMRERERQRLQALADAEPWEVFEFRATPAKESFSVREHILIHCEIKNPTKYALTLPALANNFGLMNKSTDYIVGVQIDVTDPPDFFNPSLDPIVELESNRGVPYPSERAIPPGATASFAVSFFPGTGVGTTECRVAFWNGRFKGLVIHGRSFYGSGAPPYPNWSGHPDDDGKRFQSDIFNLSVVVDEERRVPAFDETIAPFEPGQLAPANTNWPSWAGDPPYANY